MTRAIARQVIKLSSYQDNYNTQTDYVAVRALCAFTDARRINNPNQPQGLPMDRPDLIVVIACALALIVTITFIFN
jgi:hypothetical protein